MDITVKTPKRWRRRLLGALAAVLALLLALSAGVWMLALVANGLGAAGALFGLNYSSTVASKFNFNTSILVLVYVVLGGLGNMWGSIIAATVLYILPEALREFRDYRMLVYAIVLILVMLATNNDKLKALLGRIIPRRKGAKANG